MSDAKTAQSSSALDGQQSASKKTKRSKKSKNKKIDKAHPEFELTYDMMLGIRTSVGRQFKVGDLDTRAPIQPQDFDACTRRKFKGEGTPETPPHMMRDFKFKDYCPKVFSAIRQRFGINQADYMLALAGNFEYLEFISNSKSGSFFFYTHDRKFMIKTISKEEGTFLRRILRSYYQHIMNNPNTLLTRFFGMHRVKPHKKKYSRFLVMGSVFYTKLTIHRVFDLKGSTFGRAATAKERKAALPVLKDLDFLQDKEEIRLEGNTAEALTKQIKLDSELLASLGIMDYSLLLGVHYSGRASSPSKNSHAASGQRRGSMPELKLQKSASAHDMHSTHHIPLTPGPNSASSSTKPGWDRAFTMAADEYNNTTPPHSPRLSQDGGQQRGVKLSSRKRKKAEKKAAKERRKEITTVAASKKYNLASTPHISAPEFVAATEQLAHTAEELSTLSSADTTDSYTPSIFTVDEGGIRSAGTAQPLVYFVGIIDVLQEFVNRKKAEYSIKKVLYDRNTISCVPPPQYAERFQKFTTAGIKIGKDLPTIALSRRPKALSNAKRLFERRSTMSPGQGRAMSRTHAGSTQGVNLLQQLSAAAVEDADADADADEKEAKQPSLDLQELQISIDAVQDDPMIDAPVEVLPVTSPVEAVAAAPAEEEEEEDDDDEVTVVTVEDTTN